MGVKGFQKRLEEAADNYVGHSYQPDEGIEITLKRNAFKAGAELGYNEAIKAAKEWIKKENSFAVPEWLDENLAEFEKYMNKVKEEMK